MSDGFEVVPSPRPEDDGPDAWVAMIRRGLREMQQRNFERFEFVECDACAAKPGSPSLCAGCLANRHVVSNLREALRETLDRWASYYEDQRCSGDELLDAREQELRRLLA